MAKIVWLISTIICSVLSGYTIFSVVIASNNFKLIYILVYILTAMLVIGIILMWYITVDLWSKEQ